MVWPVVVLVVLGAVWIVAAVAVEIQDTRRFNSPPPGVQGSRRLDPADIVHLTFKSRSAP